MSHFSYLTCNKCTVLNSTSFTFAHTNLNIFLLIILFILLGEIIGNVTMQVHSSISARKPRIFPQNKRKGTGNKKQPATFALYKGDWFKATFINLCGNRTVTCLDYLAIFLEVTNKKNYQKTAWTLHSSKLESTQILKTVLSNSDTWKIKELQRHQQGYCGGHMSELINVPC